MFDEEIQTGANRESLSYEGLLPDGRQISIMPLKTREVSGFPLYDESRLILTKSTRPYWLPVTRAQYYQAIIRVREGVVADSEKQMAQTKDPYQEWVSQREERRQTCGEAVTLHAEVADLNRVRQNLYRRGGLLAGSVAESRGQATLQTLEPDPP